LITAQRRYELTEKGKQTALRYRVSEKGRARKRAQDRRRHLRIREKRLAQMKAWYYSKEHPKRIRSGRRIVFWVNQAREAM
jgi:hypothetical protein